MNCEDFCFEDACKTLACNKKDIFISAFPGQIIFGEVNQIGYKKCKFFKFYHFEIFHFYIALTNIFKFLCSNSESETTISNKGVILILNPIEVYYWIGKDYLVNNQNEKLIVFGIEKNSESVYELKFSLNELNELINIFSQSVLSILCIKSIEKQILESVLLEPTSVLITLKDFKSCETLMKSLALKNTLSIDSIQLSNLIDIIIHYNELLIVLQKLKSMHNPVCSNRRLEAILET